MIEKTRIESLSNDRITKKEYDEILDEIATEVDYIWRWICDVSGRRIDWWSFRNDVDEGDSSTGGNFDPDNDFKFIEIIGGWTDVNNEFYEYSDGFPTRFLWEYYKKEVLEHIAAAEKKLLDKKSQDKIKKENRNSKKLELIKSIQSKLTVEELKIVKFK